MNKINLQKLYKPKHFVGFDVNCQIYQFELKFETDSPILFKQGTHVGT